MANPGILKVEKGCVYLINSSGQKARIYYTKGDCTRADWYEIENESVQLQLSDGKVVLVNKSCQVYRRL